MTRVQSGSCASPRFAAAALVLALLPAAPQMQTSSDTVLVSGGRISGSVDRGVRVFKGIPYAAAPVGDRRWTPPQPVTSWQGVRDATAFGAECPQTQYPAGSIYVRPLAAQSEDCLFLNVWTAAAPGSRTPVLVWIHGGALTRGSGISDTRDGVPLARKGIVLVTLNYRLGALGYLAHPDLTAESPQRSSGNYGVLDQIAALEWVKANITAFGGDPANVTIAGESAGAWAVNTLVASPLAKGLFVRAIGQSGGRFGRTPHLSQDRGSQQAAEKVGLALAKTLGAATLADLRQLPAETVVRGTGFRTQENVDGWVLPGEIRTLFAEKRHNPVPVIVGSTADEMTSLTGTGGAPRTLDEFRARMRQQYGDLAPEFERVYDVRGDADVVAATLAIARDTTFSSHMRQWARATVASGQRAYLYSFSHAPPHPRARDLRAFHAGDIPYVFNVVPSQDPRESGFTYSEVDRRLAEAMSSYWVNFVKTGNPNGGDLPEWEPYDPRTEPYLEFGAVIRRGTHLLRAELDLIDNALTRVR
jgi:para-nitrobenzyl esterase